MVSKIDPIVLIVLLIGMTGGCTAEKPAESRGEDVTKMGVARLCSGIGDHFERLGFEVSLENDAGACRLEATASISAAGFQADPLESLRDSLLDTGWQEDLAFSADGPGTSSFRMSREDRHCQVDGGAPAWIDDGDEIRQSDTYFVEAMCRTGAFD